MSKMIDVCIFSHLKKKPECSYRHVINDIFYCWRCCRGCEFQKQLNNMVTINLEVKRSEEEEKEI